MAWAVPPTATSTETWHFTFNSSILSGTFEDVRILAFSKRYPSGRVGALRPLHVNTLLIRRGATNIDLLFANEKAELNDADDGDLHRISAESWRVSTSDYPEDSDLEDEPEDEKAYESAHERPDEPPHVGQNGGSQKTDPDDEVGSGKAPGPQSSCGTSDSDSVVTDAKLEEFVSIEDVLSAEQDCPPPSATSKAENMPKATSHTSESSTNGDEVPQQQGAKSPKSQSGQFQTRRTILALDVAFRTLRTFIFHAYTGRVAFAPLRSQGFIYKDDGGDPNQYPVCSPKSMYRLAVKYGNQELQAQARTDIKFKLSSCNLLDELSSRFTARYPEIQAMEIDFLVSNIKHPDITVRLPLWVDRFARGELHECANTFTLMVSKLACLAVPQMGPKPTPTSCPTGCPLPTIQTQFRCTTCGFLMI